MVMRLFVAIDISRQVRDRIERIQRQLQKDLNLSGKAVKWVRPELIHLTLKFMGDVDDRDVTSVCDVVTRTAAEFGPFEFEVAGLGVFGRPARVVWAGISQCEPLMGLQAKLDRQLTQLGGPMDNRAFAGHLTLCRVKNASAGRVLADAIGTYANESLGSVSADKVLVYQSVLSSEGPEYSVVSRARLKL
jgi:2'-5' RNA ligase